MNKLVSIIISTRNREKKLYTCLDSITANTEYRPYEIIIIVDKCEDKYEGLEDYKGNFERLLVIRSDVHITSPKALYLGVEQAKGGYAFCPGDDVEVRPQWLTIAMEEMMSILNGYGLLGFQDGENNHTATHMLISMDMFKEFKVDMYNHYFMDTELTERAEEIGKYHKSMRAWIDHANPYKQSGKGYSDDKVYTDKASVFVPDKEIFERRKRNGWKDE